MVQKDNLNMLKNLSFKRQTKQEIKNVIKSLDILQGQTSIAIQTLYIYNNI